MSSVLPSWDRLWDVPENQAFSHGPSFRHKLRLFRRLCVRFRLSGRLIDVACGTGELLATAGSVFSTVSGTDISARALKRARQLCPRATFFQIDIEKERLPETFDVVSCTNALEEMEDDTAALRNMAAMLRPGGYLVIITPHRKAYWTAKDQLAGNKRRYEHEELAAVLKSSGLSIQSVETWGWPLYRFWYRTMVHVDQNTLWKQPAKSMLARFASSFAYRLLFIDDLFRNSPRGSILAVVAQKPL